MQPVFAKGNSRTVQRLSDLRRQAQRDRSPRVVLRLQGILMSLDGLTAAEVSQRLRVHRSTVRLWIDHWNHQGEEGLLEGQRSGRPGGLKPKDREKLADILDSGPVGYGLETGIWTSPLVSQIIGEEFGQHYHPGHVRKLLKQLGYSVQRPTTRLIQADLARKRKWVRYTHPNLKKRQNRRGGDRL